MRKLCQNLLNEYGAKTKILLCGGVMTVGNMGVLMDLAEENENIEFFSKLIPIAREYGVKLAVENMWDWENGN